MTGGTKSQIIKNTYDYLTGMGPLASNSFEKYLDLKRLLFARGSLREDQEGDNNWIMRSGPPRYGVSEWDGDLTQGPPVSPNPIENERNGGSWVILA